MPSASLWAIFSGKIIFILRLSRPAGERTLSGASRQLSRRESQDRGGRVSCLFFERVPRAYWECFLPLPLGEVSPKVTERAHPLPCGELPPQRLRGPINRRSEKKVQRRRLPPAADTGRSCWGSGQQDTSAAQGTKWTLGTATRLSEAASIFPLRLLLWDY